MTLTNGFWICVDGVEGVGKSTLVRSLANTYHDSITAPEFSDSLTGRALREAVTTSPHVINESRFGQSLAFIGDFHETYEAFVRSNLSAGRVVISDRGWLSKYAYQAQVLEGTLEPGEIDSLLVRLLTLSRMPDLSIHLSCNTLIVRDRLIDRDGWCDEGREQFIIGAALKYTHLIATMTDHESARHPVITLDSSDRDRVLQQAVAALADRGLHVHDENRSSGGVA